MTKARRLNHRLSRGGGEEKERRSRDLHGVYNSAVMTWAPRLVLEEEWGSEMLLQ